MEGFGHAGTMHGWHKDANNRINSSREAKARHAGKSCPLGGVGLLQTDILSI
jgi:hypothetical protein